MAYLKDKVGGVKDGKVLLYIKNELRACIYETESTWGEFVCCNLKYNRQEELIVEVYYQFKNLYLY